MSMRALGRQFMTKVANRGKPWVPGTDAEPQGRLFPGFTLDRPRPPAAEMEANRRIMQGEGVPRRAPGQTPSYNRWDPSRGGWANQPDEQGKLFR